MNEHIKELRKKLGLNQTEFAKRIGLSQHAVSDMEKKNGSVTEKNIKMICHEFGVSEQWLRTGEGEMFAPSAAPDLLDTLTETYHLDYLCRELLRTYLELDEQGRAAVSRFVMQLTANVQQAEDTMQKSASQLPETPTAPSSKEETTA